MNSRWATTTIDRCDDGTLDQFAAALANQGQMITRRRPGDSDGSATEATVTLRVIVDMVPPRPFYPQQVAPSGGLDNLSNIDRHYLFYGADGDIEENDEILFVVFPEHLWIVDKADIPFAPNDVVAYRMCEIRRERRVTSNG